MNESARKVWREGVAPNIPTEGLEALLVGMVDDDPALVQAATTVPPPLSCVRDWPVEAADAIGYAGWKGLGLKTVEEVEEFFARVCFECDVAMGEPAACRWFLNWFDDAAREEAFGALIPEVERVLAYRHAGVAVCDR